MFDELHHRKLLFCYLLQVLDHTPHKYASTELNKVPNPNEFSFIFFLDVWSPNIWCECEKVLQC